ncbi:MAG: hypothetical protein DDG59_11890 [Anaerolineae bacterium]|nr:MAG: hypothetical protein DDG59_11890 [Anaerolineae bacterium]
MGLFAWLTLLIAAIYRPAQALPSDRNVCQPFKQVNENAFGLGSGTDGAYTDEEGFEVVVFNGQLYLGMEADNSLGARLWRSRFGIYAPNSQADWEEVAADQQGYPFGNANLAQDDHIDSLAVFGGYLYVSTANRGVSQWGVNLYRSLSGNAASWENVLARQGAGFGNPANVNFKDMQVFQGALCGGTQNWREGAQVWCSWDGLDWVQKNVSGFGDPANSGVWSSTVFRKALYLGVRNQGTSISNPADDVGKLFRTFDLGEQPSWEEVFSSQPASENRVNLLGELAGYLYLATLSPQGVLLYRSPSGDAGSWQLVSQPGISGNPNNDRVAVDGAVVYDGALYLAVSNLSSGFQLWRTSGTLQDNGLVDWEQVGTDGLGDQQNSHAELTVFNNHLYAWVTNYRVGQKVLRSHCLPCADGQIDCEIWLPELPYRLYFPLMRH